jgi:excisionase family DNA binding protein
MIFVHRVRRTSMGSPLSTAIEALIEEEVARREAERNRKRTEPYTVGEFAEKAKLAKSTVYGLIRDGKLATVPTGTRRVLIAPDAVVDDGAA